MYIFTKGMPPKKILIFWTDSQDKYTEPKRFTDQNKPSLLLFVKDLTSTVCKMSFNSWHSSSDICDVSVSGKTLTFNR